MHEINLNRYAARLLTPEYIGITLRENKNSHFTLRLLFKGLQ